MENRIETAKIAYFIEGNTYIGSKTKDPQEGWLLRYRLVPDKDNGVLHTACWDEDVCFEKAEQPWQQDFPLDAEGLESARAWLLDHYARLGQKE